MQRGGDDVIVRSRDHGGLPAHQRRHWLHDVDHALMLLLLLLMMMMMMPKLKLVEFNVAQ